MKKFGTKLKELRQEKKISQDELGKMINKSRSTIANYESGKTLPETLIVLDELSKALEIAFNDLIANTELEVYGHLPETMAFCLAFLKDLEDRELESVMRYALKQRLMKGKSYIYSEGENYTVSLYHEFPSFDYRTHLMNALIEIAINNIQSQVKHLPETTEELGLPHLSWKEPNELIRELKYKGLLKELI